MIRSRRRSTAIAQNGGGGFGRLLLCTFSAIVFVTALTARADSSHRPTTEQEFVATVKAAIETEDFAVLDQLVLWTDVGPYKRRVISAQLRHGLGRPIADITLEHADVGTRFDLQEMRGIRLNMPVTYLLRIKYADEPGSLGEQPGMVYMVGKLDGVYRIALLVKDTKNPLPD